MKKLILIAAICCSALFANAASTSWSLTVGQMYDHTGAATFAGLIELYASSGDLSNDIVIFSENPALATYNKTAIVVDSLTAGETYNFYIKLTDGGMTYTTALKPVAALETGSATLNFGSLKAATQNTGNWQAAPEPTSGIMLLVGVGLMALRRRRA